MTDAEFKEEKYLLNKDLGVLSSSNADNMDDVIYYYKNIWSCAVHYIIIKTIFRFLDIQRIYSGG